MPRITCSAEALVVHATLGNGTSQALEKSCVGSWPSGSKNDLNLLGVLGSLKHICYSGNLRSCRTRRHSNWGRLGFLAVPKWEFVGTCSLGMIDCRLSRCETDGKEPGSARGGKLCHVCIVMA